LLSIAWKKEYCFVGKLIREHRNSLTVNMIKKQELSKMIVISLLTVPNGMDIYKVNGLEVISPKYPLN
jgi:hypothetical protein